MSDATYIKAIEEISRKPALLTINGKDQLVNPPGWGLCREPQDQVAPLAFVSLAAVRDYILMNVDGLERAQLMVEVLGPETVVVAGPLGSEANRFRRHVYAQAGLEQEDFPFGRFQPAEEFKILLMTRVEKTVERDELLTLMASLRDSEVRETADDGVAQQVNIARGVAYVDRTRVPNPVALRPYRVFREVAQPQSLFILRLRGSEEDGVSAALFEADGGAWRIEAVKNVVEWLRAGLGPGGPAVIG